MAIKTVSSLISDTNFSQVFVTNLHILVDSQVSLTWLLKGSARRKNVFVCNRLKEIAQISEVLAERKIKLVYHYVPSSENIADIVSRGVSISKFREILPVWLGGPAWLKKPPGDWPTGQLGCVPTEFIAEGVVASVIEPPLSQFFKRFKSYRLLIGVFCRLYAAIYKLRSRVYLRML